MFLGNVENKFDALVGFVEGYMCGRCHRRDSEPAHGQLLPDDFHEFTGREVGTGHFGAQGWCGVISQAAGSDDRAFEMFFELLEKYENEKYGDI